RAKCRHAALISMIRASRSMMAICSASESITKVCNALRSRIGTDLRSNGCTSQESGPSGSCECPDIMLVRPCAKAPAVTQQEPCLGDEKQPAPLRARGSGLAKPERHAVGFPDRDEALTIDLLATQARRQRPDAVGMVLRIA